MFQYVYSNKYEKCSLNEKFGFRRLAPELGSNLWGHDFLGQDAGSPNCQRDNNAAHKIGSIQFQTF